MPIYYAYTLWLYIMPVHYGNPDVFEFFQNGVFSVQIGDHNPFGRIPFVQTIEETVNKDKQTAGGTKEFRLLEAPRSSDCWRHQGVQTAGGTKEFRLLEAPRSSDCWRHQGVQTAGGTKEFRLLEAPRSSDCWRHQGVQPQTRRS